MIDTTQDQVQLRRTGGFGGIEVRAELSADQLTESDLEVLHSLVGRDEPAQQQAVLPDAARYELRLRLGGAHHQVTYTDVDLPPELRPLVQRMLAAGRAGRAGPSAPDGS